MILFISIVILLIKHVMLGHLGNYCFSFILSLLYVARYVSGISRSNIIKSILGLRLNLIQYTTWWSFSEAILFLAFLILLNKCIGVALSVFSKPRGRSFFTSFHFHGHASRQYDLDFIQSGLCLNLSYRLWSLFLLLHLHASCLYFWSIFSCQANYSLGLFTRWFRRLR